MKYLIKAKIEVEGLVDRHDIIGAIFGQTENLFGEEFDLRKLQDRGRIGRVQVDIKHEGTRTIGEVVVPSNLDRVETALVAAMLESVEKVGPYKAQIRVYDIVDVRAQKIKRIVERAKEILRIWSLEKTPDLREVLREISEAVKRAEVIEYGPERLPAGPDVDKSDEIIIVEGRADVINLLRYGYRNVIALEGARGKIPETIIKLAKTKKAIAFVDGDHGGDLILWELLKVADIDYVAKAPPGKEVEELTGKEIARALRNLIPAREYLQILERKFKPKPAVEERPQPPQPQPPAVQPVQPTLQPTVTTVEVVREAKPEKPTVQVEVETFEIPPSVIEEVKKLSGTLEAVLYDSKWNPIERVSVRDVYNVLEKMEPGKVYAVAYDGIVTQRMLDIAAEKQVRLLIANRIGNIEKRPPKVGILTFSDLT
ncbi:DNA primase DnaG [Hyperthermus butylicus]|uniref:DNA primase DnaG n=1 Tax=Hyperthermus butylicus (strain DSM 5456 / JCM 9403 / PLM1-5) TaxID=415426 RepID=DNAG_HYPBU|nr:DNA primase DnaG [Hyperthermus butylicus]A2BL78.1 RecName: Full=DNA primase DnaG [Hyperthermus butylicus DSM 5456]ABM80739.1 conserved archaeal protein [Hyperthermus butylicus DSM 5456]